MSSVGDAKGELSQMQAKKKLGWGRFVVALHTAVEKSEGKGSLTQTIAMTASTLLFNGRIVFGRRAYAFL